MTKEELVKKLANEDAGYNVSNSGRKKQYISKAAKQIPIFLQYIKEKENSHKISHKLHSNPHLIDKERISEEAIEQFRSAIIKELSE